MPQRERQQTVLDLLKDLRGLDPLKELLRNTKKKSLLDSPFCGMWTDRTDIADSQSFARTLRQRLEPRGDRTTTHR